MNTIKPNAMHRHEKKRPVGASFIAQKPKQTGKRSHPSRIQEAGWSNRLVARSWSLPVNGRGRNHQLRLHWQKHQRREDPLRLEVTETQCDQLLRMQLLKHLAHTLHSPLSLPPSVASHAHQGWPAIVEWQSSQKFSASNFPPGLEGI
jgi:hypothetical protein